MKTVKKFLIYTGSMFAAMFAIVSVSVLILLLLSGLSFWLSPLPIAHATGSSMSFSYSRAGEYCKITVDWVSDSTSGAVSGTTDPVYGELVRGVTDPGSTAPADNYDVALTDPAGADLLGLSHDDLMDRDTANTEHVYFNLKPDATTVVAAYPVVADAITVSVTNADNSKVGRIILYVKGGIPGRNLRRVT